MEGFEIINGEGIVVKVEEGILEYVVVVVIVGLCG